MNGRRILVLVNLEQSTFDALHFEAGLAGEMPICATLQQYRRAMRPAAVAARQSEFMEVNV
jgi:hypothetical protein